MDISIRKGITIAVAAIILIVGVISASKIFDSNQLGYYKIKQAAGTGTISVKNKEGMFVQLWGDLWEYQISDMYYFSTNPDEGGSGRDADPIKVRFNDGGTALISGSVKFKLSQKENTQISLHRDYKGYQAVRSDLIRQVTIEALMQTATFMKAEESYSSRRSEFTAKAEEQIKRGIYETKSFEIKKMDADSNEFIERKVELVIGEDGKPKIRKKSPLLNYDIEVIQFVIKEIDFDKTIDALIAKKKEAEQQKVVAKANAERAKQDAITAEEEGKARIKIAEAEELTKKIREVTEAQKRFEVAEFEAKKAIEEAKAIRVKGEADAHAAKLKVIAGLSPLEKATIEKETAIGVADKLKDIKLPDMMIIGGSGNNGQPLDPFQAIGLESMLNIQKQMSNNK